MSIPIALIAGLGNPGSQYLRTRHNAGADFVTALAESCHATLKPEAWCHGLSARVQIGAHDVRLLIPGTYMNRSGQSVGAAANFYKHRYEWPADWVAPATSQQGRTINLVRSIGMAPCNDLADNLLSAVHVIMAPSDGGLPDFSRRIVEDWRTRLAAHLRMNFNLPN